MPYATNAGVRIYNKREEDDMFARIGRAKLRRDKRDELLRLCQESVAVYQQLPGFQRVTFLYDPASGWQFTISQWATAADAEAMTAAMRPVRARFAALFTEEQAAAPGPLDLTGPLPLLELVAQG